MSEQLLAQTLPLQAHPELQQAAFPLPVGPEVCVTDQTAITAEVGLPPGPIDALISHHSGAELSVPSPGHAQRHDTYGAAADPQFGQRTVAEQRIVGEAVEIGDFAVKHGPLRRMLKRFTPHAIEQSAQQSDIIQPKPKPETEVLPPATIPEQLQAVYRTAHGLEQDQHPLSLQERLSQVTATLESIGQEQTTPMSFTERAIVTYALRDLSAQVRRALQTDIFSSIEKSESANDLLLRLVDCQKKAQNLRFEATVGDQINYCNDADKKYALIKKYGTEDNDAITVSGVKMNEVHSYPIEGGMITTMDVDGEATNNAAMHQVSQLALANWRLGRKPNAALLFAAATTGPGEDIHELYQVASAVYGKNVFTWSQRADVEPAVKAVISGKDFAQKAIFEMLQPDAENPGMNRFECCEAVEDLILNEQLDLSPKLMDSLKTSLALRQKKEIPYVDKLAKLMERCANSERTEALFEVFGIVNFDRYSEAMLDRLYKIVQQDPATLQQLQSTKTVLTVSDALADHNGAFDFSPDTIASKYGEDTTLWAEADSPASYFKTLKRLSHYGIKPSALVVAAHGYPGIFELGSGRVMHEPQVSTSGYKKTYEVGRSRLKELVAETMQPDVNGEKHIIFVSCSLAQRPRADTPSLVEKVADMTGAHTWGSETPANIARRNDGSLAFDAPTSEQFVKTSSGTVVQIKHSSGIIHHNPNLKRAA